MKSRLLLSLLIVVSASVFASAQTFHIEWNGPDTLRGDGKKTLKRDGLVVNDAAEQKAIRIKYNIDAVSLDHFGQICMNQCFAMVPGDEDYPGREDQLIEGNGSSILYVDMDPGGNLGTSTVVVDLYDKANPTTERIQFAVTFIFDPTASVADASAHGFTVGPNPASDVVTIRSTEAEVLQGADLYAADGTLLRTYGVSTGAQQSFNVSSLPSGSYHLVLRTQSGALLRSPLTIVR